MKNTNLSCRLPIELMLLSKETTLSYISVGGTCNPASGSSKQGPFGRNYCICKGTLLKKVLGKSNPNVVV